MHVLDQLPRRHHFGKYLNLHVYFELTITINPYTIEETWKISQYLIIYLLINFLFFTIF